jgi:hypothetical protein
VPASSFGYAAGWGVYLAASLAMLVLLSPGLSEVSGGAREGAAARALLGVGGVICGLMPGTTVSFTFVSVGGDSIVLRNHGLFDSARGQTYNCRWALDSTTLLPGHMYAARLSGATVAVHDLG